MAKVDELVLEIRVDDKGSIVVKNFKKVVEKSFKTVQEEAKRSKRLLNGFWREVLAGGLILQGSLGVLNSLGRAISSSVEAASNFQQSFANVTTLFNASQKEIEKYKNRILDMAGALGSAEELTQGMYQAISAGIEPAKALNFLETAAKAAKAGLTDVYASVDALTTVLNAYGLEASHATYVSDLMFTAVKQGKTTFEELASSIGRVASVAANVGVSLEDVMASISTLTASGLSTAEAITGIRSALLQVVQASEQTKKYARSLGIEFSVAALKTKGWANFLKEIIEKTGGSAEKLKQLFRDVEGYNAVVALAGQISGKFKEDLETMRKAAGTTEEAFKKQTRTFKALWESIKNKVEAIAIKLLLPVLESIVNLIENNKTAFSSFFKTIGDVFSTTWEILKQILEFFYDIGKTVWDVGKAIYDALKPGLKLAIKFYPPLKLIFYAIKAILKPAETLRKIFGGVKLVVQGLAYVFIKFAEILFSIYSKILFVGKKIGLVSEETYQAVLRQKQLMSATAKDLSSKIEDTISWMQKTKQTTEATSEALKKQVEVIKKLPPAHIEAGEAAKKHREEITKLAATLEERLLKAAGFIPFNQLQKESEAVWVMVNNIVQKSEKISEEFAIQSAAYIDELILQWKKYGKAVPEYLKKAEKAIEKFLPALKTLASEQQHIAETLLTTAPGEVLDNAFQITFTEETLLDKFKNFGLKLKDFFSKGIGAGITEAIKGAISGAKGWLASSIGAIFGGQIGSLIGQIASKLPGLKEFFAYAERTIGRLLKEIWNTLQPVFKAIGSILEPFLDLLQRILEPILKLSMQTIKLVANILAPAVKLIARILKPILDMIGKIFSFIDRIASTAEDFISSLFGIEDSTEKIIEKQNEWMKLTEAQKEKLQELAEEVGDVHKATSMMFDELIREADITTENFDKWAKRTREILSDLDRGAMSAAEASKEIGDAFSELIKKAQELGMEGNRELINLIRDVRNRGLEVKEISEYVIEQLERGISSIAKWLAITAENQESFNRAARITLAYFNALIREGKSYFEAISMLGEAIDVLIEKAKKAGFSMTEAFKQIAHLRKLARENEDLLAGIDALNEALIGLANSAYLTSQTFNDFQKEAYSAYQKLLAAGFSEKEALMALAPLLSNLLWYAQQYGYQLDKNTQKLIEQAKAQGLLKEAALPAQEKIVMLLEEIVKLLGGKIPYALDQLADKVRDRTRDFVDAAKRWKDALNDVANYNATSGGGFHRAQHGFFGVVSQPTTFLVGENYEPELVSIIPLRKASPVFDFQNTAQIPQKTEVSKEEIIKVEIQPVVIPLGEHLERFLIEFIPKATKEERLFIHKNSIKEQL